ncbi:MAG TPA: SPFH domain-containing protein [Fimbriimonas sp.]
MTIPILLGIVIFLIVVAVLGLQGLIYTCPPSEVLIFSGKKRLDELTGRYLGFRVVKGGFGFRVPLIERVDRIDLTNMVIDLSAMNAYSKGGVPLTVQGVANVKIAGHEPMLNNAIERFLGKSRVEIMQVAKATLEGSLRGVLATMTPEQVNEDKILFAERLVGEVEQDMTNLGLVVDTLKIQNVQDDVKYLESIGRQRNAEVVSTARVAEAIAKADSMSRSAENQEKEVAAQIQQQIDVARAEAQRRLIDAQTRRAAVVAEEQAQVAALVAQAKADVNVQKARVEQIRRKLEADVVTPAKASAEAAEAQAKAATASIIEDARAKAEALKAVAEMWRQSGPNAREILLAQKLGGVIDAVSSLVPETQIEKVTMIGGGDSNGSFIGKAVSTNEQLKQVFGVDLVEKVKTIGQPASGQTKETVLREVIEVPAPPKNDKPEKREDKLPPVVVPPPRTK